MNNVWSSSEIGVIVFSPVGKELERIRVPELTGNLCFGVDGHDLYIAASTSIYLIRTKTIDAWAGRHGFDVGYVPSAKSIPDGRRNFKVADKKRIVLEAMVDGASVSGIARR